MALPKEDLDFIVQFVTASGSLKQMAKLHNQSYPSIRNRLNDIIEKLNKTSESRQRKQREVLTAIAEGNMSVADASAILTGLKG